MVFSILVITGWLLAILLLFYPYLPKPLQIIKAFQRFSKSPTPDVEISIAILFLSTIPFYFITSIF